MKIRKQFRVLLVLVTAGLLIVLMFQQLGFEETAMYAFEGVVVTAAGVLLVAGGYLQGYEEGLKYGKKTKDKNSETEMHPP